MTEEAIEKAATNSDFLKWYILFGLAIVGIYWYYTYQRHEMMKAYYGVNYGVVPDSRVDSGNSANPPHMPKQGPVIIFPKSDTEPGAD